MVDRDWTRVVDVHDILKVCFSINIISKFAINEYILGFKLDSRVEYALYRDMLSDGLKKIRKYYS